MAENAKKVDRNELIAWISRKLEVENFKDYAPNGLQVEGSPTITSVTGAVTASLNAINQAVEKGSELLLVHHGMFWKNEPVTITGWKGRRIKTLLMNDINMAGFHLPLDAHPVIGNNAMIARRMGWIVERAFGEQNLIFEGRLPSPEPLFKVVESIEENLDANVVSVGPSSKMISKVVWCSGGAQGFLQDAADVGADLYLTGEISEAQYHIANETGTAFASAGHHATERYGIQALLGEIAREFGLECEFFDENNPA